MKAIYKKNGKELIKSWKPLVLFIMLFFIFSFDHDKREQETIKFKTGSFSEVLKQALESDKVVFVYAYTSWSESHEKMQKKTFSKSKLTHFYNQEFVSYKMELEGGEKAKHLISKYHINQSPTFLFLDEKGNVLLKTVGYKSSSELIKLAKSLKKKKI